MSKKKLHSKWTKDVNITLAAIDADLEEEKLSMIFVQLVLISICKIRGMDPYIDHTNDDVWLRVYNHFLDNAVGELTHEEIEWFVHQGFEAICGFKELDTGFFSGPKQQEHRIICPVLPIDLTTPTSLVSLMVQQYWDKLKLGKENADQISGEDASTSKNVKAKPTFDSKQLYEETLAKNRQTMIRQLTVGSGVNDDDIDTVECERPLHWNITPDGKASQRTLKKRVEKAFANRMRAALVQTAQMMRKPKELFTEKNAAKMKEVQAKLQEVRDSCLQEHHARTPVSNSMLSTTGAVKKTKAKSSDMIIENVILDVYQAELSRAKKATSSDMIIEDVYQAELSRAIAESLVTATEEGVHHVQLLENSCEDDGFHREAEASSAVPQLMKGQDTRQPAEVSSILESENYELPKSLISAKDEALRAQLSVEHQAICRTDQVSAFLAEEDFEIPEALIAAEEEALHARLIESLCGNVGSDPGSLASSAVAQVSEHPAEQGDDDDADAGMGATPLTGTTVFIASFIELEDDYPTEDSETPTTPRTPGKTTQMQENEMNSSSAVPGIQQSEMRVESCTQLGTEADLLKPYSTKEDKEVLEEKQKIEGKSDCQPEPSNSDHVSEVQPFKLRRFTKSHLVIPPFRGKKTAQKVSDESGEVPPSQETLPSEPQISLPDNETAKNTAPQDETPTLQCKESMNGDKDQHIPLMAEVEHQKIHTLWRPWVDTTPQLEPPTVQRKDFVDEDKTIPSMDEELQSDAIMIHTLEQTTVQNSTHLVENNTQSNIHSVNQKPLHQIHVPISASLESPISSEDQLQSGNEMEDQKSNKFYKQDNGPNPECNNSGGQEDGLPSSRSKIFNDQNHSPDAGSPPLYFHVVRENLIHMAILKAMDNRIFQEVTPNYVEIVSENVTPVGRPRQVFRMSPEQQPYWERQDGRQYFTEPREIYDELPSYMNAETSTPKILTARYDSHRDVVENAEREYETGVQTEVFDSNEHSPQERATRQEIPINQGQTPQQNIVHIERHSPQANTKVFHQETTRRMKEDLQSGDKSPACRDNCGPVQSRKEPSQSSSGGHINPISPTKPQEAQEHSPCREVSCALCRVPAEPLNSSHEPQLLQEDPELSELNSSHDSQLRQDDPELSEPNSSHDPQLLQEDPELSEPNSSHDPQLLQEDPELSEPNSSHDPQLLQEDPELSEPNSSHDPHLLNSSHDPQLLQEDPELSEPNSSHDPQLRQDDPELSEPNSSHDPQLLQEDPKLSELNSSHDPQHLQEDPELSEPNSSHDPQLRQDDPELSKLNSSQDPQLLQEDPELSELNSSHDPHLNSSHDPQLLQEDSKLSELNNSHEPQHLQGDPELSEPNSSNDPQLLQDDPELSVLNSSHEPQHTQVSELNSSHDPQLLQEDPKLSELNSSHDPQLLQEDPKLSELNSSHDPQLLQEDPKLSELNSSHDPQLLHEDPELSELNSSHESQLLENLEWGADYRPREMNRSLIDETVHSSKIPFPKGMSPSVRRHK